MEFVGLPRVPEITEKQQGPKLFQPGQSGNPKGRPRGSRNRATLLAQELLGDEGETIMRKAIELAKKRRQARAEALPGADRAAAGPDG